MNATRVLLWAGVVCILAVPAGICAAVAIAYVLNLV